MTSLGSEIKMKMSSLLNVSNLSSKSEEINLNDIEVLVDSKEQKLFKKGRYRTIFRGIPYHNIDR